MRFTSREEKIMEILHVLTTFDYFILAVLCAVLLYSLKEFGGHSGH